ncbi:MAG: DUF5752 family protein [Candidatus Aenigmatarchaeota archaeon]
MAKTVVNDEKQAFWFCNQSGWIGQIAHSLEEFANQIKIVPTDCLEFHLRDDKNDFEAWLANVLKEKRIAKKIVNIKKQGLKGEELRKALISLFE